MSDATPPPPPPEPAETPAEATSTTPTDPTEPAAAGAAAGSGGGRGKVVALGVAGALAVAAVGGGAYAWTQLSGGGTQPHDVLPADTIAYVRLDLDPSAKQKVDLFRLAQRVPELAEAVGLDDEDDDLRRLVLEDALGDCADYEKDVEPWLGERIGLGIGPDVAQGPEESVRLAVQVTDEDAAKTGIAKLFACDDKDAGVAFLEGYAVVTPSQKSADAAVAAAQEGSLADSERFSADADALGEDGILSGWVDVEKGVELAKSAGGEDLGADAADLDRLADEVGSVAFALSASSTSLHLDAVGRQGDDPTETPEVRSLAALPEDTVVGLSVAGGGKAVQENWEELKTQLQDLLDLGSAFGGLPGGLGSSGASAAGEYPEFDADAYAADPEGYEEEYLAQVEAASSGGAGGSQVDVDEAIAEIEKNLDVRLPQDLVTLLGDALTVYVGSDGLQELASSGGPGDPSDVAAGLVMEGDTDAASDLAGRLVATVERLGGLQLATADGDDAVSLATSQDVADTLVEDGGLGEAETFRSVVGEGPLAGGLFVDVGTILDVVAAADPSAENDDVFQSLRILDAAGMTATQPQDGYFGFRLAVAFTQE